MDIFLFSKISYLQYMPAKNLSNHDFLPKYQSITTKVTVVIAAVKAHNTGRYITKYYKLLTLNLRIESLVVSPQGMMGRHAPTAAQEA